jgi:RHS repeat-associated protein
MKTTRTLAWAAIAVAVLLGPSQSHALNRSNADPAERQAALDAKPDDTNSFGLFSFGSHEPALPIAETITYDIQQLARDLENDPVRIYNYVHDHIRHVLYFGSKKGAELTFLEKSGNDFDQCALLMALLRSAGFTNANYQFGWMELPYDSADHNDLAGRLSSVTDPLLRIGRFGYDSDGRTVAITNGALEPTREQWNPRGELVQLTDQSAHTVLRAYDGAGNQTILTNRNGKRWQFQFDNANRLTNTVTPLNRQIEQVWNSRGLLQSITQPSTRTTTLSYDSKTRLTNRTDNVGTTLYQYDPNNNLTNVAESGKTNSWAFDAYDRTSSYTDADGNQIQYRWDANGNLTNLIYPGNRIVTYVYDSLNRLTNVSDWSGRQTTITYDLANRPTTISRPNGTLRIVNYDSAGQPTNIVEKLANNAPVAFYTLSWNNAGRVQWEFGAPLPHTNALPTRTMTFDDDNRLATFNGANITNDLDGNMTWGPLTNNTLVAYSYDARNRLLTADGASYGYDALGNRTSVTNGTNVIRFVVNPNATLSQVLMRIKGGTTNYYIYGPGLLYEITETASTTNTLTYHYDLRGSTIAITDSSGAVKERFEYSAYGSLTYRSDSTDTPFLFNGRYGVQTDTNGLLYMRARYYNPYICRFINPDPAGFAGGLNWYCYADGNPVSLIDPFGLGPVEGWVGATATWVNRNLVDSLNSTSTRYTAINFASYMTASVIGGFGDLLRLGQGTANAVYNAEDGYDIAMGITQDIGRAAGISLSAAGPIAGTMRGAAASAAEEAEMVYHGTTSAQTVTTKGLSTVERDLAAVDRDLVDLRGFSTTTDKEIARLWAEARAAERGGTPVVLEAPKSALPPPRLRPGEALDPREFRIDVKDYPQVGPGVFKVSNP